ncbi:hypothetical protein [Burkholderia sp. Bp9143]|uniref:hypothetical protein n=1 Tax=Burkholderia sp. Bp9143 TaxID=2184574 RepID=UPI0021AB13B1|nr:hypothetical protein [Burkholderia sp. Bp9143]
MVILPVLLSGLIARAATDAPRDAAVDAAGAAASGSLPAALAGPTAVVSAIGAGAGDARPAGDTAAARDAGFGVAMSADQLDAHRGGDALIGQNTLNGTVSDNVANRVSTGSNSIADGSFANSSGLPTVIQNTGANVLIQNATVLNVHFGN